MLGLIIRMLLVIAPVSLVCSQNTIDELSDLSPDQWQQDIDTLEKWIITKHAQPFWLNQKKIFEKQVKVARKNIAHIHYSKEEKIVELLKIIASLKDGHSSMKGGDRYKLLGYLPFTASCFKDEWYIVKVHEKYRKALGTKIVGIDNVPIGEVIERLKEVVPHANENRLKKFSPYYLHLPGLLHGLGISSRARQANFLLQNEKGDQFELQMEHLENEEEAMVDLGRNLEHFPLYRQHPERAYWFHYLKDEQLLYLKYNRVASMQEENIWSFSERLFNFIESHDIKKMVVDIRDNGGGSGAYSAPLWNGIQNNSKINQSGKLFVITGYKTFSAAIAFASYLELQTQAIFVGEGVCDRLISPGDATTFELPNSNIRIGLSKLFHEKSFYLDERISLEPDYPVQVSFSDYILGKDPILEFIKNYEGKTLTSSIHNPDKYTGRYNFSPYQYLDIIEKEGSLFMEILGKAFSPLYIIGEDRFSTEIKGFELEFKKEEKVSLHYPDGKVRLLNRIKQAPLSPMELIYGGQLQKLETELIRLKTEHPDIQFWKDHSLSGLALEAYYDLRETLGVDKAKATAKEILQIAIRVNPENHKFASYSLQFY